MDIGEITLNKWIESPLRSRNSGVSTDNSGFQLFETDEDVEVTGLDIPYLQDIQSALTIELNQDQMGLLQFIDNSKPGSFPGGEILIPELFPFSKQKENSCPSNINFPLRKQIQIEIIFIQSMQNYLARCRMEKISAKISLCNINLTSMKKT